MIKKMTLDNMCDINKANDSFNVIGRIIPTYKNGIMKIGAVDNMLYANFPTCDEKAIFWYLKF